MIEALALSAVVLFASGVLTVAVLATRRALLARDERIRYELEPRLRPVAFALIDGEPVTVDDLDERGSQVLAAMLGRYAQQLSGSSREHISAFFEQQGHVFRELAYTHDRRVWRRAMAAHGLGDMGSQVAIPALLELLVDDPSTDVREAAARSLGALRAVDAVEPLVRALVSGSVARAIASQSLLTIGPPAVPELRELATDEDEAVRGRAVELIGLLGDAVDADILHARVRDPSAEVRAKAARALGRLGADEAAAELRHALADRIPYVRATAAIALGQVGDEAAADALFEQARIDSFEPARAAAMALVRIDPDRVRAAASMANAGPHLTEAADLLAIRA
jgi:hypothetical protein